DAGNTVVVVEHDEAMIRAADHLIEVGPEPGARGGHIVFQGELPALLASNAITGRYLSGRDSIQTPPTRRPVQGRDDLRVVRSESSDSAISHSSLDIGHSRQSHWLTFTNATKHNLRNITLQIPLGRLVALSGVS